MKRSYQRELNDFFGRLENKDYSIQKVTKGALSQARAKLKPSAFTELSNDTIDIFYENAPYLVWSNHRLIACDGSTVQLPKHSTIKEEFGEAYYGPNANSPQSLARISLLYDVLNLTTLSAEIAPLQEDERSLLFKHLQEYNKQENDLLLLDRGYGSFFLIFYLSYVKKINFCLRLKDNWWNAVNIMKQNKQTDEIISLKLPKTAKKRAEELGIIAEEVKVRISIITLENGETEVLCSSLMDAEAYPKAALKELYHQRWQVEEAYKLFKSRTELERFSGKTALSVKQDFHANVLLLNCCATLTFPIEEKVRKENESAKTKHPKQVNRTNAIALIKEGLLLLFLKNKFNKLLKNLENILLKTCEIVRPMRSFKRKHKPKKNFYPNYKQL